MSSDYSHINSNPNTPCLARDILERAETAADTLTARIISMHPAVGVTRRAIHEAPPEALPQEVIALWAEHAAAQAAAIADLTNDGAALVSVVRDLLAAFRA